MTQRDWIPQSVAPAEAPGYDDAWLMLLVAIARRWWFDCHTYPRENPASELAEWTGVSVQTLSVKPFGLRVGRPKKRAKGASWKGEVS